MVFVNQGTKIKYFLVFKLNEHKFQTLGIKSITFSQENIFTA